MSLTRIMAIIMRQFYLIRSSFTRVVPIFAWQTIDIVIWGFVTKYLNQFTHSGMDFVPMILGTVLVWEFLTRVMQGTTMAFMEDGWSRNFLNIFSSPMRIGEYITGLVASGLITSLLGLVVMLVIASSVFGLSLLGYGMMIIPLVMIIVLFAVGLGIFGCAIMLRYGPASEWFVWPIPLIISPFVGVFYPSGTLPGWMQSVSQILPPTYVFEGMRAVVEGKDFPLENIIVAAVLAVLYVLLACWVFKAVYKYALKTGLIARYSAESVS